MQKPDSLLKRINILYFLLALLSMGLHGCEYDCGNDNFHFLEKPAENIRIGIDLAGVNPNETIYLNQNAFFYYSLNAEGKKVITQKFFLDGKELNSNIQEGSVYLNVGATDNQIHELKLIMGFATGSGSLAEYAGYEMYAGEYTFKVKFVSESNVKMNIRESLDENNNLKLTWDKPTGYEVESYKIYSGDLWNNKLVATITNSEQTSCSILDYAYGYKYYTIIAKPRNSQDVQLRDEYTVQHTNMTMDNFEAERVSMNEFRISWKNPNPYPCKYVLLYGTYPYKTKVIEGATETTIPTSSLFPNWGDYYSLYILPPTADPNLYSEYQCISGFLGDKRLGNSIMMEADPANKLLLSMDFNNLTVYQLPGMSKLGTVKHNLTLDTGCKIRSSKQGLISINDQYGIIRTYSDYTLTRQLSAISAQWSSFYTTDTNRLLLDKYTSFFVYDIYSGNQICSKLWTDNGINVKSRISANGRYIYALCYLYPNAKQWSELYELGSDNKLNLVRTQNNTAIDEVTFNPLKDNELIIQYKNNTFDIVDAATGNATTIEGTFNNIDPFNGRLLYTKAENNSTQYYIHVLNKDHNTDLFKTAVASGGYSSYTRLYNNILFINSSYMDLSKLIKE